MFPGYYKDQIDALFLREFHNTIRYILIVYKMINWMIPFKQRIQQQTLHRRFTCQPLPGVINIQYMQRCIK